MSKYMQFGCGSSAAEEWLNYDCSPTLRFERIPLLGKLYTKNARRFPENVRFGDIVKGLPLTEASCKGIFCSHVLEHLSLDDFDTALKHTYEYLEPSGVFRLIVPDLEWLAKDYLGTHDAKASCRFMELSCLGHVKRARGLKGLISCWLGNSAHLWMWDEKSMRMKLAEHGFKNIRRAYYGDAEDPVFKTVEEKSRFENALGMQCSK